MYERDKKIQALLKCLEHSEDLLKHHNSPEDWAELYYNYGLAWLAVMSTIPDDDRSAQARKHARENARCYFERAIAFCKKDPRLRVQVKKLTYCHLGAAAVLLDCTATAARTEQKHIPPEDIKDAQGHLDFVERVLGDCLPLGSRMHLFKTRSDQYYRQGFYLLAKETAENALHIAKSNGFKTELVTLQERIDFLNRLYEEKIRLTTDNDADNSYSDNDASSEASGSETTAKPKDPRLRVQIKQQTYIYLSLAEMLLDCSSTAARNRQKSIPHADIEEAKEHLNFVRDKLGVSVPTGTRVQLLKTRSDQFYRQGIYELAKETAEDALQIASSNGFNTELDSLQKRIDFLDKLCEHKRSRIVIEDISNSSSETCCSESE
ncbi:hypothetical protein OS493_007405 [Desmophyllum pertusum]|uniref:Uncharacterized protein n=1 Tax=Desmophyllum pertusum TaxID=174260 RepID=A0A9W9Z3D6_9CNID|nr:hypothetical protein OS493_007405 [Desmophyllum pertusum]